MQPEALNLLVFRANRRPADGRTLKCALLQRLRASPRDVEAALLLAGEFECAVADRDESLAWQHSDITDRFAEKLVNPGAPLDVAAMTKSLGCVPAVPTVSFSPPEGFAYYGLHPLAYADVLERVLD